MSNITPPVGYLQATPMSRQIGVSYERIKGWQHARKIASVRIHRQTYLSIADCQRVLQEEQTATPADHMTRRQIADHFRLTDRTVRRLINDHKIPRVIHYQRSYYPLATFAAVAPLAIAYARKPAVEAARALGLPGHLIPITEAAQRAGITDYTLERLVAEGYVTAIKADRYQMVDPSSIARAIEQRKADRSSTSRSLELGRTADPRKQLEDRIAATRNARAQSLKNHEDSLRPIARPSNLPPVQRYRTEWKAMQRQGRAA